MNSEPIKLSTPLTNLERDRFNTIMSAENELETNESEAQLALLSTMKASEIVTYVANVDVISFRLIMRAIYFCTEAARRAAWDNNETAMNEYSLAVRSLEAMHRGMLQALI